MALTQITIPDQYHPIWHPVIFEMDSDIKGNDEFKYLFILVATLFSPSRTIAVSPRPVDGFGFLDVRRHIQELVNNESFDIKETGVQVAGFANYSVQIKEQYKDGNGDIIVVPGITIGGVGMNSIFNRNDILTYSQDKYKLLAPEDQLLWNIENNTKVLKDDIFFIHFAISGTSQTLRFIVEEFFNNGTTNTIVIVTAATGRLNFRTLNLATVLTDPDNTRSIDVFFEDIGINQASEKKTLLIQDNCSIYRRHKMIYLDAKGSYNSLNFDFVSRKNTKVVPKVYKKFINAATESDVSRHITRYFVDSKEEFSVNTDILNDRHNVMLADLIKSTNVFLDVRADDRFPDSSIEFIPIEILTKTMDEAKSENQELLQKTIRYRYSYDDVTR